MRIIYIIIYFFICIIVGCKKDDEVTTPSPVNPPVLPDTININDYTKLVSGNYWVYEVHRIDSNGNDTLLNLDSAYVAGDSIFNGNTYKIVYHYFPAPAVIYLRDSSNYLVSSDGGVYLSSHINDTIDFFSLNVPFPIYDAYSISLDTPLIMNVPAGSFDSLLTTRNDFYFIPPFDTTYNPRQYYSYYSKSTGLIKYTYSYAGQPTSVYERRLLRYLVQ